IRDAVELTGLPALITENGIGTDDDTLRMEYLRRALASLKGCLDDGLDVRGYCQWSLLDNFEWMLGYRPTFGIVGVDRATQVRTPKPSAAWLGGVARSNTADLG
ncbi:MAG TPA: family 1 glycosylhydrolase, partial [Chloroflexota bacterium]|nr:family 1 glycosylhydrolase [Chloroflexota bacterium]